MTKAKKPAAQAQPQEPKAPEGVVESKVGELKIVSNDAFKVVDNTEERAGETAAPEAGKAKPRDKKLNGFTVVDYE